MPEKQFLRPPSQVPRNIFPIANLKASQISTDLAAPSAPILLLPPMEQVPPTPPGPELKLAPYLFFRDEDLRI